MKIAFVEPAPKYNLYFFLGNMPLLGPLYLGTVLQNAGHEVKVFKETTERVYNSRTDTLHPYLQEADAVGITSVTHSIPRAYEIADAVKRQFPGKKVIFGGSHPSACPEEALQHGDHVVVGEAEHIIQEVFENPTSEIIQGCKTDLNSLPPVDLSLLNEYKRNTKNYLRDLAPIMASRGCPHDCIFCSVTQMFGKKYRIRDADLVMEEFKMRYDEGHRFAFFYDDNFAASPTKTKILLEKMIEADLDFEWSSQFSIHVAKDPELLKLMKRAKCRRLYLGVESINPESLKDFHKSQTAEMIEHSLRTIQEHDLMVHAMFITGADSDTKESIRKTVDFAKKATNKKATAQFSVLYPIPGTQLYDNVKAEKRLYVDDWEYYDGSHSVIIPKNLTPLEVQKASIWSYRTFYRSKSFTGFLATQFGFTFWKLLNVKYMRNLRRASRQMKKVRKNRVSVRLIEKLKEFGSVRWIFAHRSYQRDRSSSTM